MSESKVLFEEHGKVAVIKINRPEKRNALDRETVLMINDCTEKAKTRISGKCTVKIFVILEKSILSLKM